MKKTIFILCVVLSILLIMWMVGRLRRGGNAKVGEYMASNRDTEIVIYDIDDLEAMAAEIIPHGAFDYIRCGAETENTLRRNVESFDVIESVLPVTIYQVIDGAAIVLLEYIDIQYILAHK